LAQLSCPKGMIADQLSQMYVADCGNDLEGVGVMELKKKQVLVLEMKNDNKQIIFMVL